MKAILEKEYGAREAASMVKVYFEDIKLEKYVDPWKKLNSDLAKLLDHYPLQYITGKMFFYDSWFSISEGVLIPRPETEELVSLIIKENKNKQGLVVLDVGVGSGCILLSLAKHLKHCNFFGLDVSDIAIDITFFNSQLNQLDVQLEKLDFLNEDNWLSLPDVDIIVSNPPYVQITEKKEMSLSTLKFEPLNALFPNSRDPLIFYKKIMEFAMKKLRPSGKIYLEINEFLSEETLKIYSNETFEAEIVNDLQGKPRILVAIKKSE